MSNPDHQSRKQRLAGHVANGEYFATLATILDLLRQNILWKRGREKISDERLIRLREDLLFLQQHYKIVGHQEPPARSGDK